MKVMALLILSGCFGQAVLAQTPPLALHPDNPHYFQWRGRAAVLIGSGEHYGAVLNPDFDFVKYLETLRADGLNLTRTFSGAYVEPQGAFNIARNTLAPLGERFLSPWARSGVPGYAGGGAKFDLGKWDEAYFKRLRDFLTHAGRCGVVVELNLFCPFYEEMQWKLSPMNAANNINNVGSVARTDVYTLDRHAGLLGIQKAMVRKIVGELKDFDNLYYEICNEPYFGGVTIPWQHHIAEVIAAVEKEFPRRHLISQNIANNSAKVDQPHAAVSIFNFHYAAPPDAVGENFGLNKVIGDNETGFRGTSDAPYRMEAWDFIIAGGGLYNNLDYSFVAGQEDGVFQFPASQPGGGTPALRRQLRYLKEFIEGLDFIHMRPDAAVLQGGLPPGLTARALVERGKAYAVYLRPAISTRYSVRWTGEILPEYSETYTISTLSNDGARVWIDDRLVVDDWTEHGEKETSGAAALRAGGKHRIKVEYFFNGGKAVMKLFWSSPSQKKAVVPSSRLRLAGKDGAGLQGEYFEGTAFEAPRLTRTDPGIDFSWGDRSPFEPGKPPETAALKIDLPAGSYRAEWLDPVRLESAGRQEFDHAGGAREIASPRFSQDIVLRILRK